MGKSKLLIQVNHSLPPELNAFKMGNIWLLLALVSSFSFVVSQDTTTTTPATTTTATPATTTTTTPANTTATTTTTTTATDRPFTLCSYAKNDIGVCECPDQVFIADDCHKGFFCMDFTVGGYPDDVVNGDYDGCVKECREDEVLVVDPRRGDWDCVPIVVDAQILNGVCPGKFNTECGCNDGPDACPVGDCECNGQLRVANDCHTAKYCDSTVDGGFEEISCPDGEIVYVDMATFSWSCDVDDNRCPGAFHVGCQEDGTTTTASTENGSPSSMMNNVALCLVVYVMGLAFA